MKYNTTNLTNKIEKIIKLANKKYINKDFFEEFDKHKMDNDDVTNLDIAIQNYIMKKCSLIIPNSGFIGEEGNNNKSKNEYLWILDPIDGTFNFKHKIKMFGTQICLLKNSKPIISVLYLPSSKDTYIANEYGAFKNNKKINISNVYDFNDAVISVGDYMGQGIETQQEYMKTFSTLFKRVRMFGSSCFDNCMLANGSTDAYIIYSDKEWDLLPGQFLVEKAGGKVLSNKDKNIYISGNAEIVDKLSQILKF